MKGSWYSASTRRPETLDGLPAEDKVTALPEADFFSDSKIAPEFRSRLGPSSHVILSMRRSSIAPHTLSATMAIAESLILPT